MRSVSYSVILLLLSSSLTHAQTSSTPSLSDQQTMATIASTLATMQQTQVATRNADIQSVTTSLGAVKAPATGDTQLDAASSSAQVMVLGDQALRGAADQVAAFVQKLTQKDRSITIDVEIGTRPPSIAQWIAFRHTLEVQRGNLVRASEDWNQAVRLLPPQRAPKRSPKHGHGRMKKLDSGSAVGGVAVAAGAAMPEAAAAIAAITVVASLLNVDRKITGAAVAPSDDRVRALVTEALGKKGVSVDMSALQIGTEPSHVEALVRQVREGAYGEALRVYLNDYLLRVAAKGTGKIEVTLATAGKALADAIGDFETTEKGLYATSSGEPPIMQIEAQYKLEQSLSSRAVLFIRSTTAAVTIITKKTLLGGRNSTPATLEGEAAIYASFIGLGGNARVPAASTRHFYYTTGAQPFDQVTALVRIDPDKTGPCWPAHPDRVLRGTDPTSCHMPAPRADRQHTK